VSFKIPDDARIERLLKDPKLAQEIGRFLRTCRFCGEFLSPNREENVYVGCKAGPLILHCHCAETLVLTLRHYLDSVPRETSTESPKEDVPPEALEL
jgi:hypothetical protein